MTGGLVQSNEMAKKNLILISLALLALLLYLADYAVVGTFRETVASFLGNLAFLPVYVIFITLIVEQILRQRERQTIMGKLNMVIGVFFSETGNILLRELSGCLPDRGELRERLHIGGNWKDEDYRQALVWLSSHNPQIDIAKCDLSELKKLLISRRSFLVGLLENQNLLEHEQFTDLLWAVFHLMEELEARDLSEALPPPDLEHLAGDILRAFSHLTKEWVSYMKHLQQEYPYLFSLAVRLNPLQGTPNPLVYR